MQVADVLCYVFLMITVAGPCADANGNEKFLQHSENRRLAKNRDSNFYLRSYPDIPVERIFQKSKVIYRRTSNSRYTTPKTHPSRTPKYRPEKYNKKPGKQYRLPKPPRQSANSLNYKQFVPNSINYEQSKFGPSKLRRPNTQHSFGFIVKKPYKLQISGHDTGSFGEPPIDLFKYKQQIQSYGEPPINYDTSTKLDTGEVYPSVETYQDVRPFFGNPEPYIEHQNQPARPRVEDENGAYTKFHAKFIKPDKQITPQPIDEYDDIDGPYKEQDIKDNKFIRNKKKQQYFTDKSKVINKHWVSKHNPHEEIIIGGQYAEPPAKYVSVFQPSSSMFDENIDDTFSPVQSSFIDPQIVSSANNSPYVNYKNSNMAFSPQNLNDAFSIIDK